jgi:hypothetical protein
MAFDVRLHCKDGCSRTKLVKCNTLRDRARAMTRGWACGRCKRKGK